HYKSFVRYITSFSLYQFSAPRFKNLIKYLYIFIKAASKPFRKYMGFRNIDHFATHQRFVFIKSAIMTVKKDLAYYGWTRAHTDILYTKIIIYGTPLIIFMGDSKLTLQLYKFIEIFRTQYVIPSILAVHVRLKLWLNKLHKLLHCFAFLYKTDVLFYAAKLLI
ncbi:hypothetical protein L9F63_014565, partial [Diploptera punctata]